MNGNSLFQTWRRLLEDMVRKKMKMLLYSYEKLIYKSDLVEVLLGIFQVPDTKRQDKQRVVSLSVFLFCQSYGVI